MPLAKPVQEYATVHAWLQGLTRQWGDVPADIHERLLTLERFCEFVQRDPDSVIQECSREVEGGKRIRIKMRRFYSQKIAEFQALVNGDARVQGRAGNTIRSFLIHNGIFIQGGVQT